MLNDKILELQDEICKCQNCDKRFIQCGKSPKIFCGSENIKVMIIGHSPATRTVRKAHTILNMDIEKGHLHKYITENIMRPLGVGKESVYCTNLIKCFSDKLPEDIEKTKKGIIADAAGKCADFLYREIDILRPKLIVSLSGRVFEVLSLRYLGQRLRIQQHFGELFHIEVSGVEYPYVPITHIPKSNVVRNRYFPEQVYKLEKIREILE